MPPNRKRATLDAPNGIAPGRPLKRTLPAHNNSSSWAWVGAEAVAPSDITPEHCLIACGLSERNNYPFCTNKYSSSTMTLGGNSRAPRGPTMGGNHKGEEEDIIEIISNDETPFCSSRVCKANPNCLNNLGQDEWENEDHAIKIFMKNVKLGKNPNMHTREEDLPVGLKNLGATCYVNASLQVWFRDLAFRAGVFKCGPSDGAERKFEESPIFHLQATFTALQTSNLNAFNPCRLIESLQLRTSEQQDAQEFSKLFMSHLDEAFKKQATPEVKSFVTDQFQGKQAYMTICNRCHFRSERVSSFFEIEVPLKHNSTLEDRIDVVLQPETLTGNNQYLCPQCESLQDATRYTEFRALPPVVHFSLLRFVYDISAMERKKSKHSVSFPLTLDMNRFLGSRSPDARTSGSDPRSQNNIYELRGVLLHKGPSAYHGHYEAQVYDTVYGSWFQCNDEVITKMKGVGEKAVVEPAVIDLEAHNRTNRLQNGARTTTEGQKQSTSRLPSPPNANSANSHGDTRKMSSRDAYMLIYAQKTATQPGKTSSMGFRIPEPPNRTMGTISQLNKLHDQSCAAYNMEEELVEAYFRCWRAKIMDIYRTWNVQSPHEEAILISQQAITTWLSQHRDGSIPMTISGEAMKVDGDDGRLPTKHVPLEDILCEHNLLDPLKAGNFKRITRDSYCRIVKDTGWNFEPVLTAADVCRECVTLQFQERFYEFQHPQLVHRFNELSTDFSDDDGGYWISKPWIRDWKLAKPKMHIAYQGDPAPDSEQFNPHVLCEHQCLALDTTTRQRISAQAADLLQTLYPSWSPVSTDLEPCPVCETLAYTSKEENRALRKQAEEEKAKLRHMYESSGATPPENSPCAIIPAGFIKSWRQWIDRPTENSKPDVVDTAPLVCDHAMLQIDPNCPIDLDSSLVVIKRSDWTVLETFYSTGPLIAIQTCDSDEPGPRYSHEIPICDDCRMKRRTAWTSTFIEIRMEGVLTKKKEKVVSLVTYSTKGTRRSGRLQSQEQPRVEISKSTTVKDIKVMIQERLNIPTICQQLFHLGKELDDNAATVASIGILAKDTIDLRKTYEIHDVDSDLEQTTPIREEGRAFEGTLLEGIAESDSCAGSLSLREQEEKSCPRCTLINQKNSLKCDACEAPLA